MKSTADIMIDEVELPLLRELEEALKTNQVRADNIHTTLRILRELTILPAKATAG